MAKEIVKASKSPSELIEMAISADADLDKLEKLLELQEKYETNQARKAYHKAMADFKANPPDIDKDKVVSYGNTSYKHASLHNVVKKVTACLSEHGLSVSWRVQQNGNISVACIITHELGHSEETTISADADSSGSKNSIQAIGSTISYLERYSLLSALGLAASDMDNDARVDEDATEEQKKEILEKADSAGIELERFFEWLGIETIESLTLNQYKKAIQAIKAKEGA